MLKVPSQLPPQEEAIVEDAVDCGYTVHRVLGPGFREIIYQRADCLKLHARSISSKPRNPSWFALNLKVALLINFNGETFKGNVKRVVL